MKRAIVTGGSGFIGTNLIAHLATKGYSVINLDRDRPRNAAHLPWWRRVDVREITAVKTLFSEFSPDAVFHLAARTDLRGTSLEDYSDNIAGVRSVAEASANCATVRRVVFASSMLVAKLGYIPANELDVLPTTAYGASKVEGERIVREYGDSLPSWTIVRPTSIWGPWFGEPYRHLFNAIRRGIYFQPRGSRPVRSLGFVLNSVRQFEALASSEGPEVQGRTLYLCDYPATSVSSWAAEIARQSGKRVHEVPLSLLRLAARTLDIAKSAGLWSQPPLTTFRLNNMLTSAVYDTELLERICGALPYSLVEGVRLTLNWLTEVESDVAEPRA